MKARPDACLISGAHERSPKDHLVCVVVARNAEVFVVTMRPAMGEWAKIVLGPLPNVSERVVKAFIVGHPGIYRAFTAGREVHVVALGAPASCHDGVSFDAPRAILARLLADGMMLGFRKQPVHRTLTVCLAQPCAVGLRFVRIHTDRPRPLH